MGLAPAQPGAEPAGNPDTSCTSGFSNLSTITEAVVNRRYFVDQEAGVAWGTIIFARVEGATQASGDILPWNYLTEIFRIEDGRIRGIYAVMNFLPPEITTSGWPDGS